MRPIFLGFQADEEPILVTAADGRVSKYTNSKIARDHENFKKVIGSFYKARDKAGRRKNARFDWKKIFTRKHAVHHFSHGHPITPTVIIKRKHIDNEPHYTVRVKMPKLDHKGRPTGRHIYNRSFVTKKPSSMLHKMLTDAIHSQRTGKQHRERRVVSNEL